MTDKITIDRATVQQALDVLRNTSPTGWNMESDKRFFAAIEALTEALAAPQPAQPAGPVAWMRPSENGYDSAFRDHSTIIACTGNTWAGWIPLYTTPRPQRQPLTKTKILKLKDAFYAGFDAYETPAASYSDVDEKWAEFAAAQGIGEAK